MSAAVLPGILPAIPTLVAPFHRPGWLYEEKIDGCRIIAYKRGADVELLSRTGRDHAARFSGVAKAIAALRARTLILDGEAAIFDAALVSRFDLLGTGPTNVVVMPPLLIAFDCLWVNGRDLRGEQLAERQRIRGQGARRIAKDRPDNGYGLGRWLESGDRYIARRNDHVRSAPDQLCRKVDESLDLLVRRSVLNDSVPPLHVAQFSESLPEGIEPARPRDAIRGKFEKLEAFSKGLRDLQWVEERQNSRLSAASYAKEKNEALRFLLVRVIAWDQGPLP